MTLVAVWLRQNSTLKELVFASDSRLSGGESWDACPKVVTLPRPATALAMSGDATEAYAFLLQGLNTCELLDGHKVGRTDIAWFARDLKKIYEDSRRHVSDLPRGESASIPNLDVVLGGWSWRRLRFEAYSYSFDRHGKLVMNSITGLDGPRSYGVYFAGDAAPAARQSLKRLIREKQLPLWMRGGSQDNAVRETDYLDWEPLEVLLEQVTDPAVRTVGGAPQVLKITQNGETETFVWRDDNGNDHFGGRRVLPDERFDRRTMSLKGGTVNISHSDRSISYGQPSPDVPTLITEG